MRFALLGDAPDGLAMARALVASGRHELAAYTGPSAGADWLRRWHLRAPPVPDLEEVLADPAIEGILVAGPPGERAEQLRRALQSERHVLCVCPLDQAPDPAYEAALIQADTRCVLLPLLPQSLHPGVIRLAELARAADGPLGSFQLVQAEWHAPEAVLVDVGPSRPRFAVPGWDVLRALGGEIAEVAALGAREELAADEPLLLAGRFEHGGLLQEVFLPGRASACWRLRLLGSYGRAELVFPEGWPGPARLSWPNETGQPCEEAWASWDPWPPLVERFEAAVVHRSLTAAGQPNSPPGPSAVPKLPGPVLSWQDAVRALELDDAVRRSLARRRVSALEYPEVSEEVGFKGTMTLVGCGLLWVILLLLLLSRWFPWLGWLILPVLVFFLGLQVLRWAVPSPQQLEREHGSPPVGDENRPHEEA